MKGWGILPWIFFILAGITLISGINVVRRAQTPAPTFVVGAFFPSALFLLAGGVIGMLRTRRR